MFDQPATADSVTVLAPKSAPETVNVLEFVTLVVGDRGLVVAVSSSLKVTPAAAGVV